MITNRPGMTLALSGRLAEAGIRKAFAAHGLKPGHGHVLLLLAATAPMSQQALLEELGVDPSVLVAILNDLENDGLAQRRRDPADRRRHIVELPDRGRELAAGVHNALAAVEHELFADFTKREVTTFHRLLGRIRAAADDGGPCDES